MFEHRMAWGLRVKFRCVSKLFTSRLVPIPSRFYDSNRMQVRRRGVTVSQHMANNVVDGQGRQAEDAAQADHLLGLLARGGTLLSNLDIEHLGEMSAEERIELLKHNLREAIHEALHYDVIDIRLLDRRTGELKPLLNEGMLPDAVNRKLYAKSDGNGVSGKVAATGKSYLCPDTSCDDHYLAGAAAARSSLTVPLLIGETVIGTFNIESPRADAFTQQDVQFTETFGREIARALWTLELLSVENRNTVSSSVDRINRNVNLPLDDILAAATMLLTQSAGQPPDRIEKLKQILASARSIKQSIQSVGEGSHDSTGAEGESGQRLAGLRILVVDSDERIRRSVHAFLDPLGCQVETVRTGAEALAMARLGTYDAVLADIRLPDLAGYEAYSQLRAAQPQARMILMTDFEYDSGHAIIRARQEGLRLVLLKPFPKEQLIDAIAGSSLAASAAPTSTFGR